MERVEPNWAIDSTSVQIACASCGQARSLLTEQQDAGRGQFVRLQRDRAGQIVDPDHGQSVLGGVRRKILEARVVADVLVTVGDHRAAAVPLPVADDVHLGGEEGVRSPDDRADVQVVLPVLDRDVERVPPPVQVRDDRLERPVAVLVDHVPPVTGTRAVPDPAADRPASSPCHGPTPTSFGPTMSAPIRSRFSSPLSSAQVGTLPCPRASSCRDADAELDGPGIPAELAG